MAEHDQDRDDQDPGQQAAPDETVGYGRPPEHSRFVKGQSGNPKGRPRKDKLAEAASVFDRLLDEPVGRVSAQGRQRKVNGQEAIYRGLARKALAGDTSAAQQIFEQEVDLLRQDAEAMGGAPEPKQRPGGLLVVPAMLSMEEWEAIAVSQQRRLIEETWPPEERDK